VDGDEEQQSAAVAVCDGAMGDGAEQSGDAAPSTIEEEPRAAGSAMAVPADPADPADVDTDDAATDDAATDDAATDDVEEAVPDETPGESADVEDDGPALVDIGDCEATVEPDAAGAAAGLVGAELVGSAPRRLGTYLRQGVIALVAVGVVALAVSAFAWVVPSLDGANRRFIEEAQSHGHTIAPGEQQMLVLSAARKVCDRKFTHETIRERRSTALTSAELAAVGAVFGPRTRDFTALALDTYCSR
jgi:hypothetical protein